MPNWCYNHAKFDLPSQEIYDKFILAIKDKCLFETFVPLDLCVDENGVKKWDISKTIEKWGTKWEPSEFDFVEKSSSSKDGEFTIYTTFDTAWAPPVGFYENINKKHGIFVEARFHESGEAVFGSCVYNKSIEENKYHNYPCNKNKLKEIREHIGINSDLDEFMYSEWEYLADYWEDNESDDDMPV